MRYRLALAPTGKGVTTGSLNLKLKEASASGLHELCIREYYVHLSEIRHDYQRSKHAP